MIPAHLKNRPLPLLPQEAAAQRRHEKFALKADLSTARANCRQTLAGLLAGVGQMLDTPAFKGYPLNAAKPPVDVLKSAVDAQLQYTCLLIDILQEMVDMM